MEAGVIRMKIQTLQCIAWIQSYFERPENKDCLAVIGISGGKDSAVAAALCVEALGWERVIGVLMPNGEQADIGDAKDVCGILGVPDITVNIQDAYRDMCLQVAYTGIQCSEQTKINLAPRLRMSTLFAIAQSVNGRVICTSNRSEYEIGYFTMFGDNCGHLAPLRHWTCEEVIEVGKILGLPENLILKPPSDGLSGNTDEDAFGFTYKDLDAYLKHKYVDSEDAIQKIQRMIRRNRFKRNVPEVFNETIAEKYFEEKDDDRMGWFE